MRNGNSLYRIVFSQLQATLICF